MTFARAVVAIAFAGVAGCGGGGGVPAARPAQGEAAKVLTSPAADAGAPAIAETWATLDELAARAPSLAAGMREAKREELDASEGAARLEIARAPGDTCVRVALAATKPVHAWLADGSDAMLVDAPIGARVNLGGRGPVCVRKGDAVVLRVEAAEKFRVRAVAWTSP